MLIGITGVDDDHRRRGEELGGPRYFKTGTAAAHVQLRNDGIQTVGAMLKPGESFLESCSSPDPVPGLFEDLLQREAHTPVCLNQQNRRKLATAIHNKEVRYLTQMHHSCGQVGAELYGTGWANPAPVRKGYSRE